MRTSSLGRAIVVTTSAVTTFVRLATGIGSSGRRRHRTSPVARSKTIPARGGRSLNRNANASSPSSAPEAGEDGGAGATCFSNGGAAADWSESPSNEQPLSRSGTRTTARQRLVIRGRRQRPQHSEAEQREHDQRHNHEQVDAVLDSDTQRQ